MLVKVIDHKGKERFINAAFIKSIAAKGEDQTEIEVSGWAVKVRVNQLPDHVAAIVNAALPGNLDALLATEAEQQQQNESTAIIAVIG
jgi:hypothetical protein|tara:strand:+ start:2543 stop:2806 length:264 start_codon:yes stop_codon:yes gene_type:complete